MADMKAMMRESAKAKREMEEMRRKAEADLDEILDEAIAEFEAEEDLTEKPDDDEGERIYVDRKQKEKHKRFKTLKEPKEYKRVERGGRVVGYRRHFDRSFLAQASRDELSIRELDWWRLLRTRCKARGATSDSTSARRLM